jgi:RNA polymerase sigma factor (sigma-70 family)
MTVDRTDNELALVCTARQGDKEALQALLRRNWAWLKGLVYSVLASAQDLDDVMQDICLRVITRIHTLREPERFRAWLAILARREALRYRRQRSRLSCLPAVTPEDCPGGPGRPNAELDDPAVDLEKKELCGRVLEAVERLPEKYREVFVLAQSGELTYAQMAEVLDIPITTMQIRLVRARRMIRDQITGPSEHKVRENEHCG